MYSPAELDAIRDAATLFFRDDIAECPICFGQSLHRNPHAFVLTCDCGDVAVAAEIAARAAAGGMTVDIARLGYQVSPPPRARKDKGTRAVSRAPVARSPRPTVAVEEIAPTDGNLPRTYPLTEAGNSERFADVYGPGLRFEPSEERWLTWNDAHWSPDVGQVRVQNLVKASNRMIAAEASELIDPQEYKHALNWAKASDRYGNRVATLAGARSEVNSVSPAQLDARPMLLPALNGTIDLESGRLRAHDPDDLFTRVVPIVFDADAKCPRFDQFLTEILPDTATVEYVWRCLGYSLTGRVDEHALFMAWGTGANGKSTLFKIAMEMLGPFAGPGEKDLLIAKHGESHPTGLADLHGKRFVSCQEIGAGRRWDDSTLKWLTGGDRISARRMRENLWSFEPTHKLWIATNSKPQASATDAALWRRIKLMPFERTFPAGRCDPLLPQKLRTELPGILARAVVACLDWQKGGLAEPTAVTAATDGYRAASDPLAGFLTDNCDRAATGRVARSDLWTAYETWCARNGDEPMPRRAFASRLRAEPGITEGKVRTSNGPRDGWIGVGLRSRSDVGTRRDHSPVDLTRETPISVIPGSAPYKSLPTTTDESATDLTFDAEVGT